MIVAPPARRLDRQRLAGVSVRAAEPLRLRSGQAPAVQPSGRRRYDCGVLVSLASARERMRCDAKRIPSAKPTRRTPEGVPYGSRWSRAKRETTGSNAGWEFDPGWGIRANLT